MTHKFKVWDRKTKTMYGYYPKRTHPTYEVTVAFETDGGRVVHINIHGLEVNTVIYNEFYNGLDRLIALQYVGKDDVNGKPIYEGDVIDGLGYVTYEPKTASFVIYNANDDECHQMDNYTLDDDQLEVIGNIYENTKLRKIFFGKIEWTEKN